MQKKQKQKWNDLDYILKKKATYNKHQHYHYTYIGKTKNINEA